LDLGLTAETETDPIGISPAPLSGGEACVRSVNCDGNTVAADAICDGVAEHLIPTRHICEHPQLGYRPRRVIAVHLPSTAVTRRVDLDLLRTVLVHNRLPRRRFAYIQPVHVP
jgi:hypothetical protein